MFDENMPLDELLSDNDVCAAYVHGLLDGPGYVLLRARIEDQIEINREFAAKIDMLGSAFPPEGNPDIE